MCENSRNYDVEISSILTVYVYISYNILSNDEQGSVGRQGCHSTTNRISVTSYYVMIKMDKAVHF